MLMAITMDNTNVNYGTPFYDLSGSCQLQMGDAELLSAYQRMDFR